MTSTGTDNHHSLPLAPKGPILLYDGECRLCQLSVQFILRRDRKRLFRFASLQGSYGSRLLRDLGLPSGNPDTVLLLHEGKIYSRSGAVLLMLRLLGLPWSLMYGFSIVPERMRDAIYRFVARHRYRWFVDARMCEIPRDNPKEQFID